MGSVTFSQIMSCNKSKDNWNNLVTVFNNSTVIPFVGAGMSSPTFPLWKDSLLEILNGTGEEIKEINEYFKNNQYEKAAIYVYEKLGNGFYSQLEKVFSSEKIDIGKPLKNVELLVECFSGVVFTTNFDEVLEKYYMNGNNAFDSKDIHCLSNIINNSSIISDAVRNNTHKLFKIHGDIKDTSSLVFTEEEYDNVYRNDNFIDGIKTVCQGKTFLFMGCSLSGNDRYITVLREVVNDFNKRKTGIKNYAFLEKPDDDQIDKRERELNSWGIYPIWYPQKEHEASIGVLLENLKKNEKDNTQWIFTNDKTNMRTHYQIFTSNIGVKDAFVDNCFSFYSYNHHLDKSTEESICLEQICDSLRVNSFLLIEGNYGSGKTFLTKRMQLELQDEATMFFSATDFYNIDISKLKKINRKTFIFIDAFDKLFESTMCEKDIEELIEKIFQIMQCNKSCSFVVNTRQFNKVDAKSDKPITPISLLFALKYTQSSGKPMMVVKVNGFENSKQYEEFFKNINPNDKGQVSLTNAIVKEWHKKAPASCKIPLFAYILGSFYYEKWDEEKKEHKILPDNKLEIYQKFIDKTTKGRFYEEEINNNLLIFDGNSYECFLEKIAINMLSYMRDSIVYSEDSNVAEEFSKKEIYAVDISKFEESVQNTIRVLAEKENVLSDVLNNYFFSIYCSASNKWMVSFSDMNVMCCFATNYVYKNLIEFIDVVEDKFEEKMREVLNNLGMVELQPQVMDFLLFKLSSLSSEQIDRLRENIHKAIVIYNQKQDINRANVKAMLIFYIIFLKFQRDSYKSYDFSNFFKMFYRLCMTAKALNINGIHEDGNHRYLVERYFRNCKYFDCIFRRLNYKYFNFSDSEFKNSVFEQCNFTETVFDGSTVGTGCKMKLCMIRKNKSQAININSEFLIENSIIDACELKGVLFKKNTDRIVFRQCTIRNFKLSDIDNRKNFIVFDKCVLADIKIIECKRVRIEVNNCVIADKGYINNDKSVVYTKNAEYFKYQVKDPDENDASDDECINEDDVVGRS